MPIYEYRCKACGHELEALQRVSDAPLSDCPDCGEPSLHKLISAPSFRLKGSGWYETDFKTGNKKNLAGDAEPKKTEKTGDKKTEAKPAEAGAAAKKSKSGDGGKVA